MQKFNHDISFTSLFHWNTFSLNGCQSSDTGNSRSQPSTGLRIIRGRVLFLRQNWQTALDKIYYEVNIMYFTYISMFRSLCELSDNVWSIWARQSIFNYLSSLYALMEYLFIAVLYLYLYIWRSRSICYLGRFDWLMYVFVFVCPHLRKY